MVDRYSGNRDSPEYREAVEVIALNAKAYADVVDWASDRIMELEDELDGHRCDAEMWQWRLRQRSKGAKA